MTKKPEHWVVHKFGGTSVAGADRYENVAKIVASLAEPRVAVVVSAMSKVTDALLDLVRRASAQDSGYLSALSSLHERHLGVLQELAKLNGDRGEIAVKRVRDALASDVRNLEDVLRAVAISKNASELTSELVAGHGEIWSAQLLHLVLENQGFPAAWIDAREFLVVKPSELGVVVDYEASARLLGSLLERPPYSSAKILVVTGYVARLADGVATTLKRNGSDYSASILGALLSAKSITIWTDVDGVLSADPRLVPEAVLLEDLSYAEATELAYFGAKVVHPSTMAPAIREKIPIWIRNSFRPELPGTVIRERSASHHTVKGLASMDGLAIVNVEGTGMVGIPGVAERVFGTIRSIGVSVVMISQASSEQSICFVVPEKSAPQVREALERTFRAEIDAGSIERVAVENSVSVVAAVGDNMVSRPGVSGKFLGALGRARVNVRAIAQGSSERNISVAVKHSDSRRALRAAHAGFYLSPRALSIGLIGPGLVGGTLLEQIAKQRESLGHALGIDLRVRGILSSKTMLLSDSPIELSAWKPALAQAPGADLDQFLDHIQAPHLPHAVIVDCTSSEEIAARVPDWLARGLHVVTPNKKANTKSMQFYRTLRAAAAKGQVQFLYETNVGAGLPVVHTLRDLIQTGDTLIEINGVLSGTMSFVFNALEEGKPFSEVVREAKALGYTEPDPRDDLSGMDVARKLVILAREAGLALELADVTVESLVPPSLRSLPLAEFLTKLEDLNPTMAPRVAEARARGEVLRYVGHVEAGGKASVAVCAFPLTHPFARVGTGNNIVAYRTARYDQQPLIVQGPGAGPEVTAAGVFADLLRLATYLGGP